MANTATHSPLYVTKELFETRYQGAEAIFLAGSVIRGEASSYSDLDLVVVYPKLPAAYRESFTHRSWPVEAFIHDPDTLRYFFDKIDRELGRPTLAEMISEGHEVPGPSPTTDRLKHLARKTLLEGPPALSESDLQDRRYQLSELVDDIREPRSRQELVASATVIYNELADYYFRARREWTGGGKAIVKRLKKTDPGFGRKFTDAFDSLFVSGQTKPVIDLVEEILGRDGGLLFDGYRRDVPADWRLK